MQLNRLFAAAAVLRIGVCAPAIESRNGRAMVAPRPRRTVLRGRYFFVRKDIVRLQLSQGASCSLDRRGWRVAHSKNRPANVYCVPSTGFILFWNGSLFTIPNT